MHKDLSDHWRTVIECAAEHCANFTSIEGQSLAIAREAWINAFDRSAEELDTVK